MNFCVYCWHFPIHANCVASSKLFYLIFIWLAHVELIIIFVCVAENAFFLYSEFTQEVAKICRSASLHLSVCM